MLPLIPVLSSPPLLSFQMIAVMETCVACLGFPPLYPLKNPPPSVWGLKGLGNGSLFSCSDVRSQPLCSCCMLYKSVFTATSQQNDSLRLNKTVYIWPLDPFSCQSLYLEVLKHVRDKMSYLFIVPIHCVNTETMWLCFYIFCHGDWTLTSSKQRL